MEKTVFVLGAGFSKPANAPLQSEIVEEIFSLPSKNLGEDKEYILRLLHSFQEFLSSGLFLKNNQFSQVALEDVFTPIDRCILDGISFRSYDVKELVSLREKIYSLIIYAIKIRLRGEFHHGYIQNFARYLLEEMRPRVHNKDHDTVSVISTNWDILLDNSIKAELEMIPEYGVVDYCCYISSLDRNGTGEIGPEDKTVKPGLWALGKGGFNIKLLKLHGSMNWLQCPKCQRLYVAFNEKIAAYGSRHNLKCKHCKKTTDKNIEKHEAITLVSNLIMPTFLKDLNNFQIKLIWQNASIELSEASKVVFIGYSLPSADYELRQLLSRSIPSEASIEVVLKKVKTKKDKALNAEIKRRYKIFFGSRKVKVISDGVEEYIDTLVSTK